MSAEQARARVVERGALEPSSEFDALRVEGEFDLSWVNEYPVTTSIHTSKFRRIEFADPLVVSRNVTHGVELKDCMLTSFVAANDLRWEKPVRFLNATIARVWRAEHNRFEGGLTLQNMDFADSAFLLGTKSYFAKLSLRGSKLPSTVGLSSIEVDGPAQLDRVSSPGRINLSGASLGQGLSLHSADLETATVDLRNSALRGEVSFRDGIFAKVLLDDIGLPGQKALRLNFYESQVTDQLCLGENAAEAAVIEWRTHRTAILACAPSDATVGILANHLERLGDGETATAVRTRSAIPDNTTAGSFAWVGVAIVILLTAISGVVWLSRRRLQPIKVFISYRRQPTWLFANTIRDYLKDPRIVVFLDVGNIGVGKFAKQIEAAAIEADVMIVLIDDDWAQRTDEAGQKLLFREGDWCRREIEWGLESGAEILPILIGNASLPSPEQLPPSIAVLPQFQSLRISQNSLDSDMRRFKHYILTVRENRMAAEGHEESG